MTRTNAFGLLTVIIRGFALWWAASAAFTIAAAIATGSAREWGVAPFLLIYGVLLVAAAALWLFADVLARLTLAAPTTPLFESDLALAEWQRLAFSCIGLWLAIAGGLDFAGHALRWWIVRRMAPEMDADPGLAAEFVVAALRFGVGIAVLLGARGLVGVIERLRGRAPSSPAS